MATGTLDPQFLSQSVNGEGVGITALSSPGTTLHASDSGAAFMHEVTVTVSNNTGSSVVVHLEVGGTTDAETMTAAVGANRTATFPKVRITGGIAIAGWHEGASGVTIAAFGTVNRMEL
jgi:hypothetical protein